MTSSNDKSSRERIARQTPIDTFVNEGGGAKPRTSKGTVVKGPRSVDPSDLTTAKQFEEARGTHR
jgi:hypothetical protein